MSRREMIQQPSDALIERILSTAVDSERAHTQFAEAVSGMGSRVFDLEYKSRNGQTRDLRIHLFDVNDAHGELLGRGQLWQDITDDKEIDRMKSTLLSAVSHELRTPLASIKGYASTLLASDVEWDAESQTEFLQTISDETDRLTKLVKNLMDMSRIEAGLVEMNCELYSLVDLLNEVIHSFDPSLVDRLKINRANNLSPISMDVSRIGTVMRNLMENAAKYSLADSPIELTMDQQNGTALFSVRDYGPGVSPQFQDKIFDRFVRADNRFSQHVGGAGLGLAICKGFVEAHGGRIWVQSANPGAIFTFSLPIEGACED
jgi:K+-sensing histidine kinase KdpD